VKVVSRPMQRMNRIDAFVFVIISTKVEKKTQLYYRDGGRTEKKVNVMEINKYICYK